MIIVIIIIVVVVVVVTKSSSLAVANVQHVAMSEEVAGEVEADGQRVFLGRLLEPDDGALYLSFADAEHPHSVDSRLDLLRTAVTVHRNSTRCASRVHNRCCYFADRFSGESNAIGRVRPSLRLFPVYL